MKNYVENNVHYLEYTPLHETEPKVYGVARPDNGFSPILFRTATSEMRMVSKNNKQYFEHLKVDGTMDLLEDKGKFQR